MKIKFKQSDGGREASGIEESRDCTVRAFSHAGGCAYIDAWKAFIDNGRKQGHKVSLRPIVHSVASCLEMKVRCVKRSGSLRKLIQQFPSDKLIVTVRGHAFAVLNGTVHDTLPQSANRTINHAWVVE